MPSTSSQGSGGCSQSEQTTTPKSTPKHTDMAELAKHEAEIEHRTLALKREGFWSLKRLSRITEPVRPKVQWDYLCEEMQWLSADFAQERRWKRGVARKVVRMVMRHHEELRQKEERAKREEQAKLRRVASSIAKEVRAFWSSVEKVTFGGFFFWLKSLLHQKLSMIHTLKVGYFNYDLHSHFLRLYCHLWFICFTGEMSMEELLEKYRGAYASDFEEPSASVSPDSSEESEGTEEEAEEETEGEDSADNSSSSSGELKFMMIESLKHMNYSQVAVDSDKVDEDVQESDNEDDGGEGMEVLLREGDHSPTVPTSPRPKKEISHIAATAESLQPKGYTLATTKVKTPIPFLLHGTLREYQHIGLDWLVTMNEKKLNGILADEMGLGKTIQTIALLAHLACVKGNWGPHLIIVPTSVMLNWEMELKRWCPGFKILTYYGSQKERKLKRQGWTKPNAFHVCITSYKLVLQDHQAFRRKSWRYLILDEAQNIKNFKSQRWQSLLNFNSQRRLLLTGTPLQNSLMELWSLMHFLMPHVFQSHREFKEWFSNPLTGMIEGSQEYNEGLVKRLHKVLRPFLLRRIKADVEKQMPKKYEHVVRCRLSKRQRFLYDDFMAQASTRETLTSGHFMSVINILMQLRKVCNHPNLFDPRPIQSPFITKAIIYSTASLVHRALETSPFEVNGEDYQQFLKLYCPPTCNGASRTWGYLTERL
uniref:Snf2-related CREBBP activator protein n=1 Tax=Sinocyclocheilus grahami TaxID=75366 RepID=A0A672KYL2_SINGR